MQVEGIRSLCCRQLVVNGAFYADMSVQGTHGLGHQREEPLLRSHQYMGKMTKLLSSTLGSAKCGTLKKCCIITYLPPLMMPESPDPLIPERSFFLIHRAGLGIASTQRQQTTTSLWTTFGPGLMQILSELMIAWITEFPAWTSGKSLHNMR